MRPGAEIQVSVLRDALERDLERVQAHQEQAPWNACLPDRRHNQQAILRAKELKGEKIGGKYCAPIDSIEQRSIHWKVVSMSDGSIGIVQLPGSGSIDGTVFAARFLLDRKETVEHQRREVRLSQVREKLPPLASHATPLQVRVRKTAEISVSLLRHEEQTVQQRLQAHPRQTSWMEARDRYTSSRLAV